MEHNEMMEVLLVKPLRKPQVVQIEGSLESMQKLVGGLIELIMPFEDEVAIVCNEEGKFMGCELNRSIRDEDGEIVEIIAGDFFICYAPYESENFLSLPKELMEKYNKMFEQPEMFFSTKEGIKAVKFAVEENERARGMERER